MKLAIFDLDGTLFNPAHRQHLADERKWGEFHRRHTGDTPYLELLGLVGDYQREGWKIAFLTGRCESCRPTTVDQLQSFVKIGDHLLFMRQLGDNSPAPEFKAKIVRQFTDENHVTEVAVYDDCEENLNAIIDVLSENRIVIAFLCKEAIINAFFTYAPTSVNVFAKEAVSEVPETARILRMMADTFEERNKVYGSNYERVGPIMAILFPDGLTPEILHSDQWHLFELIVVKLTRFAISDLQHKDSIHDAGVYSAMIESILEKKNG